MRARLLSTRVLCALIELVAFEHAAHLGHDALVADGRGLAVLVLIKHPAEVREDALRRLPVLLRPTVPVHVHVHVHGHGHVHVHVHVHAYMCMCCTAL